MDEIEEEVKVEVLRLVSAFSQKLSIMLKIELEPVPKKEEEEFVDFDTKLLIY